MDLIICLIVKTKTENKSYINEKGNIQVKANELYLICVNFMLNIWIEIDLYKITENWKRLAALGYLQIVFKNLTSMLQWTQINSKLNF